MYVELIDARGPGKIVDMNPTAANDLISQGRAKRAFSDPSPAAPPLPGAYSGTHKATVTAPTDTPQAHIQALNAHKAKNRR